MCVNPNFIHREGPLGYRQIPVPCKKCWACRVNRQNDLIGRALCEASMSDYVHVLTLTYDDQLIDPKRKQTSILDKSDFQKFMKRLRKREKSGPRKGLPRFNVRYLVAGEYGSTKGRAHFHAILLFKGEAPKARHFTQQVEYPYWPWGYVYSEDRYDYRSMRYVAKYLTKATTKQNEAATRMEWVQYSKQPPMGADFVKQLARDYAASKISPHVLSYQPPGADKGRFQISGALAYLFFEELENNWSGFSAAPKSEWVANAYTRFIKQRHLKAYNALPDAEKLAILSEWAPEPEDTEPLTQRVARALAAKRLREGYARYDEKVANALAAERYKYEASSFRSDGSQGPVPDPEPHLSASFPSATDQAVGS